jgi:hypothetical protein
LERGNEFAPAALSAFDVDAVDAVVRLARLTDRVVEALHDCPEPGVRRSAAVLAARAHPILAAFDVST